MNVSMVAQVEIGLNMEDGTYMLQVIRGYSDGKRIVEETVFGKESIPEGLRALADQMEEDARNAFFRRRTE